MHQKIIRRRPVHFLEHGRASVLLAQRPGVMARLPRYGATMSLWLPLFMVSFVSLQTLVYAAPPVVELDAVLTRVSDGTAPFAAIDPNGSNGQVATLDEARYTFDVNVNTLDGHTHSVSNWTIVATLNSAEAGVRWLPTSLPVACATRTVSTDGKTLTCVLSGTYTTGTTLNVSASWFASSGVPDGSMVTASFVTSATMVPDSSDGENPVAVNSGNDSLEVVSEPGTYEVRKGANREPAAIIERDGSGNPTAFVFNWSLQVEIKSPTPNMVKGISTADLGTLSMNDLMASAPGNDSAFGQIGELVNCTPVAGSNNYHVMPLSHGGYMQSTAVSDSGSWNCTQPGGAGEDIDIEVTGIDWAPEWFPHGGTYNADALWAFNSSGVNNETYNAPTGQNNRAAVATQFIAIRYPYADFVALDNTPADLSSTTGTIRFCNNIGNISVDNAADHDDPANNRQCASVGIGSGLSVTKAFSRLATIPQGGNIDSTGPEQDLGMSQGVLSSRAGDNYVVRDQKFGILQSAEATGIHGTQGVQLCDVVNPNFYNFAQHVPGTTSNPSANHTWYSWERLGDSVSGFDDIADGDIIVEFASVSIPQFTDQRTLDCDDAGITWSTDPTTLAGGVSAVSVVRTRLLKTLAPGNTVRVFTTVKTRADVSAGDRLINILHYKSASYNGGAWYRPAPSCNVHTEGGLGIMTPAATHPGCDKYDRAFVIEPTPRINKTDVSVSSSAINVYDTIALAPNNGNWTYTVRAGMSFNHDLPNIQGVKVYDVMSPGLSYVSATITPELVVRDCDYFANPACITDPAARTNVGYTSLMWDRGDFSFNYTGAGDGAIQHQPELFGRWQVTAKVAGYIPNNTTLQNRAYVASEDGLMNQRQNFRNTATAKYDEGSGASDDDWIRVTTAQAFNIDKEVVEQQIPLNGTVKYTLGYGNLSGVGKVMDAIDILPYNGDGRMPASDIDGEYSLSKAEGAVNAHLLNNIYITSANPASLNKDPSHGSNPAAGTGIWSCTYAQAGTSGCPALNQVTAVRIVSGTVAAGEWGLIRIELTTNNNDGLETYSNSWFARATNLALPVESSIVYAQTPQGLIIGDTVFIDTNKNGRQDADEQGVEGVELHLMSFGDDGIAGTIDDVLYKQTTTDAAGNWKIYEIIPGQYYLLAVADNFAEGAVLYGYINAPGADDSPDNFIDQDVSHDAYNIDGHYRTRVFTVLYDNPLGELGSNVDEDMFDNLTIDLGFVLADVDVPQEPNPSDGAQKDTSTGLLPITGQARGLTTLITLALSVALLLAVYRRSAKYTR